MSIDLDGTCAIQSDFTIQDGTHLRCKKAFGHEGDHDWLKHRAQFRFSIFGGVTQNDMVLHALSMMERK